MTTYTFSALTYDYNYVSGEYEDDVDYVQVSFVVQDNAPFRYSVTEAAPDDLQRIKLSSSIYNVVIDGDLGAGIKGLETWFGNVSWSGGQSVLLMFDFPAGQQTDAEFVLQVGGASLPNFSNSDQLAAWENSADPWGPAGGSFAPGQPIAWDSIPGMVSTEHDTIIGGRGRDRFYAGEGNDKVYGNGGRDKLFGGVGNDIMTGGAGTDALRGGKGKDILNGGAGNDVLIGGRSADTFVFSGKFGNDTITDFNATNNREDIDLSGVRGINGFRDLRNNHMSQDGDNVLIDDLLGNTILLEDVNLADLGRADFIF